MFMFRRYRRTPRIDLSDLMEAIVATQAEVQTLADSLTTATAALTAELESLKGQVASSAIDLTPLSTAVAAVEALVPAPAPAA